MIFPVAKLISLALKKRFRHGLRNGVAAAVEHEGVLRSLEPQLIVDIGANKGQFALIAAAIHPTVPLIAFEPLSNPSATFRRVFSDYPKVRLHQVAIGPGPRIARMNVSARLDSSSLLPIGEAQAEHFAGTASVGTEDVDVAPLSQFIQRSLVQRNALLKIDVQGYELETLKACEPLLSRFRWIYVELSFVEFYTGQPLAHEVVAHLAGQGFRIAGLYNVILSKEGRSIQCDCLFESGLRAPSEDLFESANDARVRSG
jgi:FkbM family methyltransferase